MRLKLDRKNQLFEAQIGLLEQIFIWNVLSELCKAITSLFYIFYRSRGSYVSST